MITNTDINRRANMKKSRPHNRRLVGTYNKVDDLYYFLLQQWNKDKQEYELVQSIPVERFELNEQQL
jgi:hypothetical protein